MRDSSTIFVRPTATAMAWRPGAAAVAAALVLSAATPPARAQGPRPFSVRDLVAMERLGDPQPSPDGRRVVFTRRAWDEAADRVTINLWVVPIDGGEPRRLTAAAARDTSPRWSPDGTRLAFVSDRGGSSQIWFLDPAGGEARPLTDFPVDVDNPQWSPDGTRLLFTAEVYPDCDTLQCTADRDREREASGRRARVYDRLPVRHWDVWEDGKRSHPFVWTVGGGAPVDLMQGADADSPTKPFGGPEEIAWSPDGRQVAFTAKIRPRDAAWTTDLDVWLAAADGSGSRCLTEDNEAVDTQPVFSPDGRLLAYVAMSRPGYESDRLRLMLLDLQTGRRRALAEAWDRSPDSLVWSPDGRRILVTAEEAGRRKIFAVDVRSGKVAPLVSEHYNGEVRFAGRDRLVFLRDSLTAPAEVFRAQSDGSDPRPLTRVNAARLERIEMVRPEDFWFAGAGGDRVRGFLLRPAGFRGGRKYPVAFLIHGGPQGAWLDHFHYRWNPQAFAGAGYVTVAIDFHGSTGYGQAFTDSIRMDWGGKPYEDLMKGLDHVIATYDFVDGDRVCALGASYGGYMVNWIAGQTDRFRCLVSHDGEFDLRSGYYATEELWFPEWEQGGTPWERPENYERFSPHRFVDRWKTPMLVIHGALDYRLPETEGIAVFNALQRRGVPSQFLHFPDENHWVLKPKNSLLWHDTVLGWLGRWLGARQGAGDGRAPGARGAVAGSQKEATGARGPRCTAC
jgi:dipeptidyl aminopeptidase/acylaminoacyl peptidase